MTHTPLPPTAKLLQAILSRRAVEATERADYYAISDMAAGAQCLAENSALYNWLGAVITDANNLAAALVARRNHG
jgi:hypothetical protein